MAKAKVTHKNKLEVVANPRVEVGLSPKQEKFAMIYATEEVTQTEAALRAGYAESNAHAIASRMLNGRDYPNVLERVRQIKIELQHKFEVSFESHVKKLAELRDTALQNGAYSAAVQAEYRRGQAQGDIYISKSEVRHGSIDSMSKEEVEKALKEIKEQYAPITVDITPTQENNAQNRSKARKRVLSTTQESDQENGQEVTSN